MTILACPSCGAESRAGARYCDGCGSPLAAPAPERRKLATLLFCDMSGSTAMGERVDAESIRELMFQYFHTMRAAIERHGGTVEKFVGDAVMAVFGVPTAHEDDALRAVRAASEMQERLAELNLELERRFGTAIALRIGLNTGEVVAGDSSSRQTIVTGDAVNVAARLEQAAAPGEILLGEPTYRLVRAAVSAEPVEPLPLKGKSEPLPAYRLVAVQLSAPTRPVDTKLVGRELELALLNEAFERAVSDRHCELVTVVGEPGVGKSRLAGEFVASLSGEAQVLSGRCLSYGEGITWWSLGEIVRSAAGIRDEHTREEAHARLAALLVDGDEGLVIASLVARALGLADGVTTAEEVAWALRKLFETLAQPKPLLLLVDDIHWAEAALLDLFAGLSELTHDAPMLLLCLARPELLEERPDWPGVVRLEPLAAAQAHDLIARLPRAAGLAAELRERVGRAAGGNPLFAEELVAFLAEEGSREVELPPTLTALLGARLDRLTARERSALECGSVEGELFHRGAAAELARADVEPELTALTGKDFLRPGRAAFLDEAAFRFRHILIRDAAYNATAKRLRAELHERFADWLERMAGERAAELEEILGYHLEQAVRYLAELGPLDSHAEELARRAAARLASAGARALQRSDLPATINLLARALSLLEPEHPDRARVLRELGTALGAAGEFERGRALLAQAIELAEASGDLPTAARGRLADAEALLQVEPEGAAETALDAAAAAIPILERAGNDAGLAEAWELVGRVHFGHFEFAESTRALESARAYAERAGNERKRAWAIGWLAAAIEMGDIAASEGARRCKHLLEDVSLSRDAQAGVLGPLSTCYAMLKQFDRARRCAESRRSIFRDLGDPINGSASAFEATIEMLAGEWEAAERLLREGCAALDRLGEKGYLSTHAGLLAQVLYERARYEADHFTVVSEEAAASDDVHSQVLWRGARGKILARRGGFEEGERLAREAITHVNHTDALNLHAGAVMDLGEVIRLAGRKEEARSALEEALALYERKGNLASVERASAKLAGL